ncbi:uncharacterized protein FYW61_003373 [Anableps anableps]
MEAVIWSTGVMFQILVMGFSTGKADYTCYSSSSSKAKEIRTVYDKNNDIGEFWLRNSSELLPCNFSSISSSSKCSVCLDDSVRPERVLVVTYGLTSSVQLVFEGQRSSIDFNQTECPRPEPMSATEPSITRSAVSKPAGSESSIERGRVGLCISLACFVLVVGGLAYKRLKSRETPVEEPHSVSVGSGPTALLQNGPAAD